MTLVGEEKRRIGGGADFEGNVRNFLDAVQEDDPSVLNAPISEGVVSASLCHLGNISTRLGRRIRYDATTGQVPDDAEASRLLTRHYRKGYELPKGV